MQRLGLVTVLDIGPFVAYCCAYSRWKTAEETLLRMANREGAANALLIRSAEGNPRINPVQRIASKAAEDMLRFSAEFGMTQRRAPH
ncbi:P27 family phage terminase small subunit [Bradyrhizobium elkanii]|uniref:P27 family phage terminase small subunit n=1 Tax=Bradyrhizobium elkanii TaxID=29448 RepID=UPI0018AD36D9|nr:P27 family phage terminase small subunit [Bradyrhizobium elkanii]